MIEISEKLLDLIYSLPKDKAIRLMFAALNEMQSYNGQSQTSAICRAINAEEVEDGRYRLPSTKELKKLFD